MSVTAQNKKELIDLTFKYSGPQVMNPTAIKQLYIARSDAKNEGIHTVYKPSMCFMVQGEKDTVLNNKTYSYKPTEYLITSADLPAIGKVTQATAKNPYLCLVVEIEPSTVYEILKDSEQMAPQDLTSKKAMYVGKTNDQLTDAVLRLVRTLKNKNDSLILAPLIVREIVYHLLNSKYGDVIKQLGVAGSQMQRIGKVIDLIRKDFAKNLKTEDLARLANMSPSSFHHHFKQVTTMSPLQYQKQIRLQEARRLLAAEIADAANAGFQVGYESPSQFSREYARLFGLPPISDIKRLRASM